MVELQRNPIGRIGLHLLGIVALMWPALINGQPFFFSDTTAYVRAADLAVQLASKRHIRTAWSRPAPVATEAPAAPPAAASPPTSPPERTVAHGSDGSNGNAVMAGRSPYFGMLLYLAYGLSDFWLFVVALAIVGWWLIGVALRCFGCTSLSFRLAIGLLLALVTTLPLYTSLLLADGLAGLGILAFLILTRPPADLTRREQIGLALVMVVSAASHLTHIAMFAGMAGVLGLLMLVRAVPRARAMLPLAIAIGVVVIGLISVMITSVVVTKALGKPPAVAPLMTARFVVDGPGRDFIRNGCGGRHFVACTMPTVATNSDIWLWSDDPRLGGFLTADAATRAALSAEDTSFARAVIAAYPARQIGMLALNTWRQLTVFDARVLDEYCFAHWDCNHSDVPAPILAKMVRTPAGQGLWPREAIAAVDQAVVVLALIVILAALRRLFLHQPEAARMVLLWFALLAVALLINAFLGGAISNPQSRYQERVVWLVPFLAMLAGVRAWGAIGSLPAARGSR